MVSSRRRSFPPPFPCHSTCCLCDGCVCSNAFLVFHTGICICTAPSVSLTRTLFRHPKPWKESRETYGQVNSITTTICAPDGCILALLLLFRLLCYCCWMVWSFRDKERCDMEDWSECPVGCEHFLTINSTTRHSASAVH